MLIFAPNGTLPACEDFDSSNSELSCSAKSTFSLSERVGLTSSVK